MGAQDDDDDDGDAIAQNLHQTCPQCEVERWPWDWAGFLKMPSKNSTTVSGTRMHEDRCLFAHVRVPDLSLASHNPEW